MEVTSCCACFVTEQKFYSVEENNLQQALEDLTDLPVRISSLPLYLCYLCRALVMKFAAFRAAYRYTHLILRTVQKGQIIFGEINRQEQNVRKKAGISLATSSTINIDIYNEKENKQMRSALKSEVNDNKNLKKFKIKKEFETEPEKTIYIDSDLIKDHIKSGAKDKLFNNIDCNDRKVCTVQNDHDYTMSDCGDDTKTEAGKENNQEQNKDCILEDNSDNQINIKEEFLTTGDANSDIWELDPKDESENFYSNKRIKLTHTFTEDNENNKPCTNKRDKQNGNDVDVDQQNKNNITNKITCVQDRYDVVFTDLDKYSFRRGKKTLQDYEEFAKRYNMKVDFLITKEEQMNAFLARKETDKYKKAPYKCELCYIGFSTNSAHTNHMKKHEKYKYRHFECEFCHRHYPGNQSRRVHLETHRVNYTCLQCGDVLTMKWCLEKHFKVHAGVRYECKTCSKSFRLQSMYYKHIRTHGSTNGSSASLVSCSFCDDAFNGPVGLKVHMQWLHPEAKGCFCASCGRQFSNEAARTTHEDCCSPDISPCVRCGVSFPSDERLAEHVAEDHKVTYDCRKCKRRFQSNDQLRYHQRSCLKKKKHPNKRKYSSPSDTKEKKYRNKEKYSEKPLESKLCEICGKTVNSIYVLRDHLRIHSGEKPYKCNECGKEFRVLTTLQVHLTTHTDVRRYKCSLCPKAFKQPGHLKTHMCSHTKERPYACKSCPKRYTGQGSLKEHVDTAHRGLPPRQRGKKQEKQE